MAIRPIRLGLLSGGVSARIGRGYLYVDSLSSISSAGVFRGSEQGKITSRAYGVSGVVSGKVRAGYLQVGKEELTTQVVSSTLTLTHSAEFGGFPTTDTLSLTHDVVVTKDINESLSDTIGVAHALSYNADFTLDIVHSLTFLETLTKTYELALSDSLVLTQDVLESLEHIFSDSLSLSHSVEVTKDINESLSDTLTLTHTNEGTNLSQSASDTLALTHSVEVSRVDEEALTNTLTLTDSVVEEVVSLTNVGSTLVLTQTLSFTAVRVRSITDTLTLTELAQATATQGSVEFSSTGTWTCPAGVASVIAECWGGGGGAGFTNSTIKGGGGGGGAYSKKVILVTEGVVYDVSVGAAGAGGIGTAAAADGGDSWFKTSAEILAKGGKGGTAGRVIVDDGGPYNAYGMGGAGGDSTAGIGTTKYSGGLGCTGFLDGRGASSAGTGSNGTDANTLPTTTPTGAGAGGIAAAGSAPGGGGGTWHSTSGYAGGAGKVTLSYIPAYLAGSTLTLSHTLSRVLVKDGTTDSTLSLSHTVELYDDSILKHDTLELTHDLVANVEREISFSDTLSLSHDAVPGAVTFESLDHTLSITHDNIAFTVHNQTLSDSIVLSDSLEKNAVFTFNVVDTVLLTTGEQDRNLEVQDIHQEIGLSQTPAHNNIVREGFTDSLALLETLGYTPRYEVLSNSISLSHSLIQNLVLNLLTHSLSLSHSVVLNCERTFTFTDSLDLSDEGAKTARESIADTISLTHALLKIDENISTLVLTDSVSFDKGKLLTDALALAQVLGLNTVLERALSHNLSLGHAAIAIVGEYGTCTYNPISTVLPSAPSLVKAANVTYTCGPTNLILRSPAIGDADELSFQKVLTETSGGTLLNYRKSTWPKQRILNYTFDNLDTDEKSEVSTFLKASLGKQVTLVDYWGRTWLGVITNPDTAYEDVSRTTRTVTIRFQGVIQ